MCYNNTPFLTVVAKPRSVGEEVGPKSKPTVIAAQSSQTSLGGQEITCLFVCQSCSELQCFA